MANAPAAQVWTLITGATSGLGEAIALEMAGGSGCKLILTGRRADALADVAARATALGAEVRTVTADLVQDDGIELIAGALDGLSLGAAVLNAGVTHIGPFENHSAADYRSLIHVNAASVVTLSLALLPALKEQSGRLMLVASMGGLAPVPYQSVYAGSKAFVVNFGFSLAAEKDTAPASVCIFAPGGIETAMTQPKEFAGQRHHLAPARQVAVEAVTALQGRKTLVIPGWQNKTMAAAVKILPRRWAAALVERSFRRSMQQGDLEE